MIPVPIELPTEDGPVIRGQCWRGGPNWAVLVHDVGDDLDAWGGLPATLVREGYTVVTIDLPGHGLSDDPWDLALGRQAIVSVIQYARSDGARRTFLVVAGSSAGCLDSGVGDRIDALVGLSPGMEPNQPDVFDRAEFPRLFLVGSGDPGALEKARDLFRRGKGWAVMSSFPVKEQGIGILRSTWKNQAREQIVLFLRDYRVVDFRRPDDAAPGTGAGRETG